ncbi:hypothetical protein ACFO26_09730 [Lactococcus nasutitermitis]|uniref:Uncharacterized protein n=1 Tax=Lactococcus nasutitermitis TaxID=1652957 RepID=A0ABV9JFN6_9LACT|nr:hypothetical protein [Lactococcus nasutitermitis]
MKAKYGNMTVDVWQISKIRSEDAWLKEAFSMDRIYFTATDKPQLYIRGGFGGTWGEVGDYLIYNPTFPNNYQIISQHKAKKELAFIH